jgi:hypothetical protein
MQPVPERRDVTAETFQRDILPAAQPVILRGFVAEWPAVKAAQESLAAFSAYLRRWDRRQPVRTVTAPASVKGAFFYNSDITGFNYAEGASSVSELLDLLEAYRSQPNPPGVAAQSIPIGMALPGFPQAHPMPLVPAGVQPGLWLGNATVTAIHQDPSENIACVLAGRRRFTVIPPDQVGNLYLGPFEITPAGAAVSMADPEAPDLERFPRFREALAVAQVAELEPGDALFVPYMWWHHVRSLDPLNAMVNYWWAPESEGRGSPRDAFFHAMLAIKDLPEPHRQAWRASFEHYVFQANGPTGGHLPPDRRGIMERLTPDSIAKLRTMLMRALSRADRR